MGEEFKKEVELLDRIVINLQRKVRAKLSQEVSQGIITPPQYSILTYLLERGESKMADLSRYLLISASGVTGIVDNLVRMGLVQRGSSPQDRRVIKISLTPRGKELISRIRTEFQEVLQKVLVGFSVKERRELIRLLGKMEKLL